MNTETEKLTELVGLLIPESLVAECLSGWPNQRTWSSDYARAARRNHILLICREHGFEPADAR